MPRAKKSPTPGSINPGAPSSPGGTTPGMPSTPTGLPYGEHQQLANAQSAVPVGGTPMPAPPSPTGPPTPGGPTPTPAGNLAPNPAADTLDAATQFTPPNLGMGGPSDNPGEHVTAPITGPVPVTTGRISQTLAQAAQLSGSTSLLELAKRAQALGQ